MPRKIMSNTGWPLTCRRSAANIAHRLAQRQGLRPLAPQPVNLRLGNLQRPEQKALRRRKIAFRIRRRHATLVRPEKMHILKQASAPGAKLRHNLGKKCLRNPSAGKRHIITRARIFARAQLRDPIRRRALRQFGRIRKGNQFETHGNFFVSEVYQPARQRSFYRRRLKAYFTGCGLLQPWPFCDSKSSAAIGPHVPAA